MAMIAGERSGVGKTTVTLALLASMARRGLQVQSYKVGPDYIDPMFHGRITGRPCRNLDPVLTSPSYVQWCYHGHAGAYTLTEGVMGLFDGADLGSTAQVAKLLDLPVILVLNCASISHSIAAIAAGYRNYDPQVKIAGIVLNRVGSDRHLEILTQALEPLNLPILGVLRRAAEITLPDRHLGLVPAAEINQLSQVLDQLADLGDRAFDWPKILPLLNYKSAYKSQPSLALPAPSSSAPRIAIAQDLAFNFYYQDNLDLITQMGAELIPFSPLADQALPPHTQGLILGGGFPEVFAAQLSDNLPMRQALCQAIAQGLPVYGECGGLMYLCRAIANFEQQIFPMVGIFADLATMTSRLTLGYRRAQVQQDTYLLRQGETLVGHEFHRSEIAPPTHPLFFSQGYGAKAVPQPEGFSDRYVHGSYLHLHFGNQLFVPQRFLQACAQKQV
ncbi:MAG: cobyrinate a,c-diamide synthase [Pseudanabaenaceae cyanobacterium bins.68]|nr:cobyrinate a,c-diamide synthase [Pseudanabaenaceae cyanobacterium bins.68]